MSLARSARGRTILQLAWLALAAVCATGPGVARADAAADAAYPGKPVRLVVPQSPGSATDVLIRMFAPKFSEALGQAVVIENRTGAGGIIGAEAVAKATPDGYTLLVGATSWITIAPHIYRKLGYDPVNDFAPVSLFAAGQNLLVVNASSPIGSAQELIALMKARPGQLNMASAGMGASSHLAGVMFTSMSGVSAVHVPYKGAGPAVVAIIAGEAQWIFTPMQGPIAHVRSGKLRALAVGGSSRSSILPEVPTVAESGLPGFDSRTWFGLLAPAGTSKAIIDKLHAAVLKTIGAPEMRELFLGQGAEPTSNTPAEFLRFIRDENERMGAVVKVAGIRAE